MASSDNRRPLKRSCSGDEKAFQKIPKLQRNDEGVDQTTRLGSNCQQIENTDEASTSNNTTGHYLVMGIEQFEENTTKVESNIEGHGGVPAKNVHKNSELVSDDRTIRGDSSVQLFEDHTIHSVDRTHCITESKECVEIQHICTGPADLPSELQNQVTQKTILVNDLQESSSSQLLVDDPQQIPLLTSELKNSEHPSVIWNEPGCSQSEPGGSQSEPGGSQSDPGGSQSEPGGSHSEPGGSLSEPSGSHNEPGGSQSEPGGSQSDPGGSQSEPGGSQSEPGGSQSEPSGSHNEPGGSQSEPGGSHNEPGGPQSEPGGSQSESHGSTSASSANIEHQQVVSQQPARQRVPEVREPVTAEEARDGLLKALQYIQQHNILPGTVCKLSKMFRRNPRPR